MPSYISDKARGKTSPLSAKRLISRCMELASPPLALSTFMSAFTSSASQFLPQRTIEIGWLVNSQEASYVGAELNSDVLPRALSEIYDGIRDNFVVRKGGRVIACAALHVTWVDLAEIRSLAVDE